MDLHLPQRRRDPTVEEISTIQWLACLSREERERVLPQIKVGVVTSGACVCRVHTPSNYWYGTLQGLLRISIDTPQGGVVAFTGVPSGGWFGEGTVLKREPYMYNAMALRPSVVAGLPSEDFHWLVENSIGFNQFLLDHLSERLGQLLSARETDRVHDPAIRVARSLVSMFNTRLYPGKDRVLRISQQELSFIAGASRSRVNEALKKLSAWGMLRMEYSCLRVDDLEALRRFAQTAHPPGDASPCTR